MSVGLARLFCLRSNFCHRTFLECSPPGRQTGNKCGVSSTRVHQGPAWGVAKVTSNRCPSTRPWDLFPGTPPYKPVDRPPAKLTRADLCDAVCRKVGLSRTESATLIELVLKEIADCLERGETVKLSSFGSFVVRKKGQRIGRNPKTGKEVPISARQGHPLSEAGMGSVRHSYRLGIRPGPAKKTTEGAELCRNYLWIVGNFDPI
jgi:integration host factor subunit alpha